MMNASTGLSMSEDYMPTYLFKGIRIHGGAGQSACTIKVLYANGSIETIPIVSVAANDYIEIYGLFAGIYKTGTTATGLFPLL